MNYEMEMRYERKMARKEGRAEGLAEGRAEGRAEGEQLKLIQLVAKKVLKGKSLSVISSELEETEDSIKPIYDLLVSTSGAAPEEILDRLQEKMC